ncbi:uncharacterized abhydrolase domain-containing protein DDB_G0269086-like [Leptidea sinapis]|uniref:uncharacterized abhydrolase domain-containing protein DDB_G0269086-like n=1 Tax=Leptidea sinapis TaxID=189913 RepID=UPI00212A82B7|nr:uncharacterized abhydrolase domain-containing protein DDB_G0269086-like [Leptidea sinapis]
MASKASDFEIFEKQFAELVAEFQQLSISETRLRDALRAEATRAEAAEAARDALQRNAIDARANAEAAAAGAAQVADTLTRVQDELTSVKMELELKERQRSMFEEKCSDMNLKIVELERELLQIRPIISSYSTLQCDYLELQEKITTSTELARREASRLEGELRRVEKCASAGTELRERARLAAAAHARERRLVTAELHDTARELQRANVEITHLKTLNSELQYRLSEAAVKIKKESVENFNYEVLMETKAALKAERNTTSRLEQALATAVADNMTLAAQIHAIDNKEVMCSEKTVTDDAVPTNICPLDLFLAE